MGADPYVDPETGVLVNLLGIEDEETLRATEAELAALRIAELHQDPPRGDFDLDHLCEIHRRIFRDVYGWAGQLRTVAIGKSEALFAQPEFIESYAAGTFEDLRREDHLQGLPREQFIERLAYYFAEVNAIHPFREGNGRAQRVFFDQLARSAGYKLEWWHVSEDENEYASRQSLQGNLEPLEDLLSSITSQIDG